MAGQFEAEKIEREYMVPNAACRTKEQQCTRQQRESENLCKRVNNAIVHCTMHLSNRAHSCTCKATCVDTDSRYGYNNSRYNTHTRGSSRPITLEYWYHVISTCQNNRTSANTTRNLISPYHNKPTTNQNTCHDSLSWFSVLSVYSVCRTVQLTTRSNEPVRGSLSL